jgi:hypothetical protein
MTARSAAASRVIDLPVLLGAQDDFGPELAKLLNC